MSVEVNIHRANNDAEREEHRARLYFDVVMICILSVNLSLMVFDALFGIRAIGDFLSRHYEFFAWYGATVHPNFLLIDAGFICIYVVELIIRWRHAIHHRTYGEWWLYPVFHWYDILGLLPIPGFRLFRIIRVWALLMRLHCLGVVDVNRWHLIRMVNHIINVLMEEISDRVVLNILNGVKKEVQTGNDLAHRITENIIDPRKDYLSDQIALRMETLVDAAYKPRREYLRTYTSNAVTKAIAENDHIKLMNSVPYLGEYVAVNLKAGVSEIVFQVIDSFLRDMGDRENTDYMKQIILDIFDDITRGSAAQDEFIRNTIIDVIDEIAAQVRVKQWQDIDSGLPVPPPAAQDRGSKIPSS
jgi:hypothetical protein